MSTATITHLDSITGRTPVWVDADGIIWHARPDCPDATVQTDAGYGPTLGKFPCGTCIDVDVVPQGHVATRLADSVDRPENHGGTGTGAGPKGGPASPKQLSFIESLRAQVGETTYSQALDTVCPDGRQIGRADASDLIDRLIKARDAATPKGTPTWSPKQDAFLRSLFEDRQIAKVGGPLDGKSFDEFIAAMVEGDFITTDSKGASALIDAWKAAPRKETPKAAAGSLDEDEDGFFVTPDGKVVKVQFNRARTNRYAKVLDTETGAFEYAGKAPLRWELERLTAERAAELGRLYGMCVACGATLTDEDSIERGLGPICANKF